ncbi:MAG: hypothetical protein C0483_13010 [Pirellula sp.]|nr:hypothetical protein [Pirellula sp.]
MKGMTSLVEPHHEEPVAMSHSELVERYAVGAQRVREAVAGMSPEQIASRPIPGKWSTLEVVAHLADFEIIGVDRLTAVIAEDSPTLPGRCEQRYAARLHYLERDIEEQLQIIELCRSHTTRILRRLTAEDWTRPGVHTEAGPLTLMQLLERVVRHVEHHVPFIHEKRKALGI